jgi:hypothetical protein
MTSACGRIVRDSMVTLILAGLLVSGCGCGSRQVVSESAPVATAAGSQAGIGSLPEDSSTTGGKVSAASTPGAAVSWPSGGDGARGRAGAGGRSSSASREAYLASTKQAREAHKARAAAVAATEAATTARQEQGQILYEGAAGGVPRDLLKQPGVRLEVSKDRPGEVKVRRVSQR